MSEINPKTLERRKDLKTVGEEENEKFSKIKQTAQQFVESPLEQEQMKC